MYLFIVIMATLNTSGPEPKMVESAHIYETKTSEECNSLMKFHIKHELELPPSDLRRIVSRGCYVKGEVHVLEP